MTGLQGWWAESLQEDKTCRMTVSPFTRSSKSDLIKKKKGEQECWSAKPREHILPRGAEKKRPVPHSQLVALTIMVLEKKWLKRSIRMQKSLLPNKQTNIMETRNKAFHVSDHLANRTPFATAALHITAGQNWLGALTETGLTGFTPLQMLPFSLGWRWWSSSFGCQCPDCPKTSPWTSMTARCVGLFWIIVVRSHVFRRPVDSVLSHDAAGTWKPCDSLISIVIVQYPVGCYSTG